jgi:hypothetical protein
MAKALGRMVRGLLGLDQARAFFVENFGLTGPTAFFVAIFIGFVLVFAVFWFFHSAPPDTLTITSGPPGSIFQTNAEKYRDILRNNGVELKILPSEGSRENLERLVTPSFAVDIGFVQGGVGDGLDVGRVVSLGSISPEPLLVFYKAPEPVDMLAPFRGKRLAIGPTGSGTRALTLALLSSSGITSGGSTTLVDLSADDAAKNLTEGKVDAIFLMADFASVETMRSLMLTPGVRLLDFVQADAYTRRFVYLDKRILPEGAMDFEKNVPGHDVRLIGPMVELLARPNLHPALSDLLIETASEVHGKAGILKRQGEFPTPLEHEFRLSADAKRFYKSGKGFLYRYLPFWMASLFSRIIVVFVPTIVVLVPVLRVTPALYRLRTRIRINRWYGMLLVLERDVMQGGQAASRNELLKRLDRIEEGVNRMRVPASFGDQFYVLRQHIGFVRGRIATSEDRAV